MRFAAEHHPAYLRQLPQVMSRLEHAGLPSGTLVHLGWAVRQLADASAYIPALAQETLLSCYGGLAFAAGLDARSEAFRAAPAAQPEVCVDQALPPVPANATHPGLPQEPDAVDAVDAATDAYMAGAAQSARQGAQRGRRGRGRGRGRGPREPRPQDDDAQAPNQDERPSAAAGPVEPLQEAPRPRPGRVRRSDVAADGMWRGFCSLDAVAFQAVCQTRVLTLQAAPWRTRSTLRAAMRYGLQRAVHPQDPEIEGRGWKFFFLAPRMLLYRAPGESSVPAAELDRRCEAFRAGQWAELLEQASATLSGAHGRGLFAGCSRPPR